MAKIQERRLENGGEIRLFGRNYQDAGVRARVGALIENAGCFPSSSVWDNLMMQAINLGLADRSGEINRVLKIVRMEDSARLKFKKCSLGMKQRIGVAMALLGDPTLRTKYGDVREEDSCLRVYDTDDTEAIAAHLLRNGHVISEIRKNRIGLEEYYIELMSKKEVS